MRTRIGTFLLTLVVIFQFRGMAQTIFGTDGPQSRPTAPQSQPATEPREDVRTRPTEKGDAEPSGPTAPAAAQAIAAYEQARAEAASRLAAESESADKALLAELTDAMKAAMQAGDLAESNAIQTAIDRVRQRLEGTEVPRTAVGDAGGPRSQAGKAALANHARATAAAEAEHRRVAGAAGAKLLNELEAVKKSVLAGGDLNDANRIQTAIDAAKRVRPATAAVRKSARTCRVYTAVKGEAELFLNGKRIGTAKDFDAKPIDTQLARGDVLLIRASSPFVYRAFRVALVPEGQPAIGLGRTNCRYLGEVAPEKVTPASIADAKPASPGRADEHSPRRWEQTGGPDAGEWLGLPAPHKWYTFAYVVP